MQRFPFSWIVPGVLKQPYSITQRNRVHPPSAVRFRLKLEEISNKHFAGVGVGLGDVFYFKYLFTKK